jgi:hypothetical protein
MKHNHTLARLIVLISMAWFILWACAPMMSAPPAPPIPSDHNKEFGLGGNAGAGLDDDYWGPVGSVQLWQRFQVGTQRYNEVGFMVQGGWPTLVSGGLYYRINTSRTGQPTQVGHQFEAGGAWFGYSLPVAIPLNDTVWLTTQPSLRASAFSIFQMPVGLSVQSGNSRLDLEVGAHFGGQEGNDYMPGYNTMLYGGLGISHQFGKPTKPFRKTTRVRKKSQLFSSIVESLKEAKGTPTEHVTNTTVSSPEHREGPSTVSSEKPFYLECETVNIQKYPEIAHLSFEREQKCTFTQKGRSYPFRLQPGSHFACNWSGGSTLQCVNAAK